MVTTINREASDKNKGFRLQKFRAAFLMLDAFDKDERAHVYAAIEHVEDVFFKNVNRLAKLTHHRRPKLTHPSECF